MNKYYAITYKLYTIEDGVRELTEEAPESEPFIFISGFGTTIPGFEKNVESLEKGQDFDFVIEKGDAYGEYVDERVIELDKHIFEINGKFDDKSVHKDAIIPLQNEDGVRFMGQVLDVTDTKVKVDLNHPLAGCDLNFVGKVLECREATMDEIQKLINSLSGGCSGGCGNCGGGCHNEGECDGGGCGDHCGGCK